MHLSLDLCAPLEPISGRENQIRHIRRHLLSLLSIVVVVVVFAVERDVTPWSCRRTSKSVECVGSALISRFTPLFLGVHKTRVTTTWPRLNGDVLETMGHESNLYYGYDAATAATEERGPN